MKEEDRKNSYQKKKKKSDYGSSGKTMEKAELSRQRIIQKNLLYVIGLAPEIAKEEILSQNEYLGQYGKINKIVVNKNHAYNPNSPNGPSYSAYVTFNNERDSSLAIYAINDFRIHNREIKASFGTTKYCTFFLNDEVCNNNDCLYLHSIGKERESFSKDYIIQNKNIFADQQKIAISIIRKYRSDLIRSDSKKPAAATIFPSVTQVLDRMQSECSQRKASDCFEEIADRTVRKYSEDIAHTSSSKGFNRTNGAQTKKRAEKLINTVDFHDFSESNSTKSNNNNKAKKAPGAESKREAGSPSKEDLRGPCSGRLFQSESKTTESSMAREWRETFEQMNQHSDEKHNNNSLNFEKDNTFSHDEEELLRPINFLRAQSSPGADLNNNLLHSLQKHLESSEGELISMMLNPEINKSEQLHPDSILKNLSDRGTPEDKDSEAKNELSESQELKKLDPERELKHRIRRDYLFSSFEKKDKSRFDFVDKGTAEEEIDIFSPNCDEETEDEHSVLHRSLLKYLLDVKLEEASN